MDPLFVFRCGVSCFPSSSRMAASVRVRERAPSRELGFSGTRVSRLTKPWSSQLGQCHSASAPSWLRMGSPLSEDFFRFFEASSLASEFSPLCSVAHSPCRRVGFTQHALRWLLHSLPVFEMTSVTQSRHFPVELPLGAFFLLPRSNGTRCSRKTSSHTLSFSPNYLQDEAMFRERQRISWPCALDSPRRPVRARTLKTKPWVAAWSRLWLRLCAGVHWDELTRRSS